MDSNYEINYVEFHFVRLIMHVRSWSSEIIIPDVSALSV